MTLHHGLVRALTTRPIVLTCLLSLTSFALEQTGEATVPYGGVTAGIPTLGKEVIDPDKVFGKEYSHDRDYEISPPGVSPDPEQIIAWDGSGGVANGVDFSGTRPSYQPDGEGDDIDAIANHRDALFNALLEDRAHMIFSIDDLAHTVTPGGPSPGFVVTPVPPGTPLGVVLGNGNTIGGSGEVSYELGTVTSGSVDFQAIWAKQADINAMPFPTDVDGLEVWGPEPGPIPPGDAKASSDTDKYSLDVDAFSGGPAGPPPVSVWNGGSLPGAGTAYILHSAIVAAVTKPVAMGGLGPVSGFLPLPGGFLDGDAAINLDALIVQDVVDDPNIFQRDQTGGDNHDRIIFSIRQILDPGDPDGFYATGSELWVLDATGSISPLVHGGHVWDHAYAKTVFGRTAGPAGQEQFFALDINALEAIGASVVPEPAACWLALMSAPLFLRRRRRT